MASGKQFLAPVGCLGPKMASEDTGRKMPREKVTVQTKKRRGRGVPYNLRVVKEATNFLSRKMLTQIRKICLLCLFTRYPRAKRLPGGKRIHCLPIKNGTGLLSGAGISKEKRARNGGDTNLGGPLFQVVKGGTTICESSSSK